MLLFYPVCGGQGVPPWEAAAREGSGLTVRAAHTAVPMALLPPGVSMAEGACEGGKGPKSKGDSIPTPIGRSHKHQGDGRPPLPSPSRQLTR